MEKIKENISLVLMWVIFLALSLCGVIGVVMLELIFKLILI
ncbi:hypothetical protein [Clostridium sardiniense]